MTYITYWRKTMQIYTFDSEIKNGAILLPEEYKDITPGEVRVTLRKEESLQSQVKKTYNAIELDISGFKFNREEANARR